MLDALYLGSHNWISPAPIVYTPFPYFSPFQDFLLILRCRVACFSDSLFRCLSSPIFQVSLIFIASTLDSSCWYVSGNRNVGGCFPDMLVLRVFPWSGEVMYVLAFLPVWYYDMELTSLSSVLLMFLPYSMVRGQEETYANQAGRRRGPGWDTPFASSIISSFSMEELRSYCQISDNIDGPAKSTTGKEDDAVYFTREQLVVRLHFPVSSLIKQFLHFSRAPPTLIHPNVIRILTGLAY